MGQTLENGVYLPSEGERNCYAGLKTNWEILDQKVADVTALQQAVAGALHRQIVASLPTTDIDPNTIYMILSGTSATENVYNEFMYVNNAWELIGTSATDLTNYYTKSEVDGKLLLKANDSDVVHKSGDETISGTKTFLDVPIPFKSSTAELGVTGGSTKVIFTDKNLLNLSGITFGNYGSSKLSYCRLSIYDKDSNNRGIESSLEFAFINNNNNAYFRPNTSDVVSLGSTSFKWKQVYAINYYYGSNNVEFSTKFVTTDTNQTISGNKTFSDNLTIYNSDDTVTPKGLIIRNAQWGIGESGETTVSNIKFLDKNSFIPVAITASKGIFGQSYLRFAVRTKDSQNNTYLEEIYFDVDTSGNVEFRSWHDNIISLGTSAYKWKDVQTNKINDLEPSSLSLPSGNLNDVIDISSYFANTGSGDTNSYTASANGWIYLRLGDISGCQATVLDANNNRMWGQSSMGNVEQITIPILKGQTLSTQWNTSSTVYVAIARFIPCQGNV